MNTQQLCCNIFGLSIINGMPAIKRRSKNQNLTRPILAVRLSLSLLHPLSTPWVSCLLPGPEFFTCFSTGWAFSHHMDTLIPSRVSLSCYHRMHWLCPQSYHPECVYVHMCVCLYMYVHVCVLVYVYMYVLVYVCARVHVFI